IDRNKRAGANAIRILLPLLAGLISVYLVDVAFAPGTLYQVEAASEGMRSTKDVFADPLSYLELLRSTYSYVQSKFYFLSMLGAYIGFLEYVNPSHGIYLALVLMIMVSCLDNTGRTERFHKWDYLWMLLPVVIAAVAIPAMLLKDTPVTETVICGIQGRYFLPVFPLVLLALDGILPHTKEEHAVAVRRIRYGLILAFGALQCYFIWNTMTVFLGR
ncbi:MAG: DUF2142 domain-containing protein, partial [Lachnospiraceae bacterium]|nr:DUF2142 domain-containing protein [Lachnospiraceae bacterium]